jgi:hypothetical protein
MSKEKETVKIEIPNSKISAYFPVFGGCLAMLLLAIFISLDVKDLFIVLAAMTTVGIIVTLLIKMVEPSDSPNASWGSPDIYSINPKTNILKYRQHSHGDGRNVNLSKVYKLIFTNCQRQLKNPQKWQLKIPHP